jgi:hypothetical protein
MAIKMGGVVFVDDDVTKACVCRQGEENLHGIAVDTFLIILLADPKYETMGQGLQQTATAAKTQFPSIDVATINLSYCKMYPLACSTHPTSQWNHLGPGVCNPWMFQGKYNNGTHQRTKRASPKWSLTCNPT